MKEVIIECDTYIRNKVSKRMLYGKLKSLEIPDRLWQSITLDFVVKLLASEEKYIYIICDLIYVIIDRLTKETYIIA